jgi:type II secretory pathway pseudopilin PulG
MINMTFNKQHIQGWTLVEVAIVIIIVGLLLGGVLKGRAIITNARIKNLESSYESIARAIDTYQELYHNLPGDDDEAEILFEYVNDEGESKIINNGNADGKIEQDETGQAWQHLRAAKLIVGSPDDVSGPLNAFGGNTEIGYKEEFRANSIGFTQIPKEIAYLLDEKKDDGIEGKGRVRQLPHEDKDFFNVFFLL